MGHRAGGVWLPFAEIGAAVFPRTASTGATGGMPPSTLVGIGVHVAAMYFWTLAFVWLADRLNRVLAAIMVGAANFIVAWLVTRFTGAGLASVLSLGDRVTFALILMIALVVGMRYARPYSRNARGTQLSQ